VPMLYRRAGRMTGRRDDAPAVSPGGFCHERRQEAPPVLPGPSLRGSPCRWRACALTVLTHTCSSLAISCMAKPESIDVL
jgi:hypothetical protein